LIDATLQMGDFAGIYTSHFALKEGVLLEKLELSKA